MSSTLLTKSKYMQGLICPTTLWLLFNDKEKVPEFDMMTQHRMDQGTEVGQLAKQLFPSGMEIPQSDFMGNIRLSKDMLKQGKTFFEPGFMAENLYSRADVLVPVGSEWDIVEVKSSTEVKDEHIQDIGFQKYVYEKCGLKIRRCFILHVNKEFKKDGEIDPLQFFIKMDVTDQANEANEGIENRIKAMFEIIRGEKPTNHCESFGDCPVPDECWGHLPTESVMYLYRGGKKSVKFFDSGIKLIKDIPKNEKLTNNQLIQFECAALGKPHVDKHAISNFLKTLEEPIYYLDFETYSLTIPRYDGMKPNQHICFQYSLHIQNKGAMEHHSFIADSTKDPRKEFIQKLKSVLGTKGTIIVYNQSFEQTRLKELAENYPEFNEWVESLNSRFVDLLIPFRNFAYYNPAQEGSASIKEVLPALTGRSYKGLEIANGGDASILYYKTTLGDMKKEEIDKIRHDLEIYCGLDTEAMVLLVEELKKA